MLISKIYNNASEEVKEGLAVGLVWGLVWGLAVGLAGGLVWGLVWGLAVGLAGGLVWGLVSGLVSGLVLGLVVLLIHFNEAFPFISGFLPFLYLILAIIIIAEILYHLERYPKNKYKSLWFVAKRKIENIFEVLLGLSAIGQIYVLAREIKINQYLPDILKWTGYIGAGVIVIVAIVSGIYLYLQLNQWIKLRK